MPRSVKCVDAALQGAAACESGEREAGRSFGQGQVDRFEAAGGRFGQACGQGLRRSGDRGRAGHGGADAAGGAGAAALIVVLIVVLAMPGRLGGVMAMGRGRIVMRRHDRHSRRSMRARNHACRSDALEGNRQQHQPHECAAQTDMDGIVHGAILAWHSRNASTAIAGAGLATPGGG